MAIISIIIQTRYFSNDAADRIPIIENKYYNRILKKAEDFDEPHQAAISFLLFDYWSRDIKIFVLNLCCELLYISLSIHKNTNRDIYIALFDKTKKINYVLILIILFHIYWLMRA